MPQVVLVMPSKRLDKTSGSGQTHSFRKRFACQVLNFLQIIEFGICCHSFFRVVTVCHRLRACKVGREMTCQNRKARLLRIVL